MTRKTNPNKKNGPAPTYKTCNICNVSKPRKKNFTQNFRRSDGFSDSCRECKPPNEKFIRKDALPKPSYEWAPLLNAFDWNRKL